MITVNELTPELWGDLEKLFGPRGACGGCWCMYWRIEKGEKWDKVKGENAKERFKKGVVEGNILGALAFENGNPIGWCTFGGRRNFSRLDRAPSLACNDADRVWSIPCFFIPPGHRGKGVATALLSEAIAMIKARGGEIIEGYPSRPGKDGKYVPAFAWTGTQTLFGKAGFEVVGNKDGGKQRVRLFRKTGL